MRHYAPLFLLVCALVTALFTAFGDESYGKYHSLKRSIAAQRKENEKMDLYVTALRAEVRELQKDSRVLEKAARNELGLAGKDEMLFFFEKK